MAEQRKCCAESDSHVIAGGDDFIEAESFMGNAEDELILRETVQIAPDLFNGGEPVSEDSELVSQYQLPEGLPEFGDPEDSGEILPDPGCLEAGFHDEPEADDGESCPEAESHIIIDEIPHEESDDFMGTAEDERALRDAFRNKAIETSSGTDPRAAPEPAGDGQEEICEDWYLDWDPYMAEIRRRIEHWDEKHDKFSRKELSNEIYRYTDERLKSKYIIEKFGGVFEDGILGMDRELLKVDSRLWDAFIDDLCIMRLDLNRLDWKEILDERTRVCAENVSPSRIYGKDGDGMWGMKSIITDSLKSSQLIEKFNAEIRYDRQYDRMEVICDERLLDKAIADFADKLNRLKPLFLKEKEDRNKFDRELYEISRAKAEAANAGEIAELREKLEAERAARQKAETEAAKLLAEKKELESGLAEKAQAAPRREAAGETEKAGEQAAPLAGPERREREIRRIRDEWADAEMEGESRILALKRELIPAEAELSRIGYEHDRLNSAYQLELRKRCEEENSPYWTPAQLSRIDGTPWRYEEFKAIREKVWPGYAEKLTAMKERMLLLEKGSGELREAIADQERALAIEKMEHEARLQAWGASLDPAALHDASDDFCHIEGAAPDYVLPGLPLGKIGNLSGPPGLGKTSMTTQLGLDIACGRNGLVKGGVPLINGEDDRAVMEQRRASTLASASPAFSESELSDITDNFVPWYLDGKRVDLSDSQSEGARIFRRKLKLVERDFRRKGVRLRLIVLDTLSNFNGGEENQPEQAAAVLEALQRICLETGASLVFVHHLAKGSGAGDSGADSVRGHSSLINYAKWVMIMAPMSDKEAVRLGVAPDERQKYVKMVPAKCNYLSSREPRWYRLDDHGVFVPADFGESGAPEPLAEKLETVSEAGLQEPEEAGILHVQPKSENPRLTSQQPDSSGLRIGNAAGQPLSRKPRPVSGTGPRRFDRSTGG